MQPLHSATPGLSQARASLLDHESCPLGLGCFGMSHAYGPAERDESLATIHAALDAGCRLLDTADSYGGGENEQLVGKAVQGRRDDAILCTKVGFVFDTTGKVTARCATPEHIKASAESSLQRLGVDRIDLYTLHRVDPGVPIEDTIAAMAELVHAGKVKALGLSEVTGDQLLRAHATHPIQAVQSEYSLWTRAPERDILPLCRKLGIAFVAFAPLGRGFFSGLSGPEQLAAADFRRNLPRFQQPALQSYQPLIEWLQQTAARKACTTAQLALAWVLQQGPNVFAIPGTRRRTHLHENLQARSITWTADELDQVDRLAPVPSAHEADQRYPPGSLFAPG